MTDGAGKSESPLIDLSIREFLARLGSDAPTPGGGACAAFCGAMAASLGIMVCDLTLGRPKFAAVEAEIRTLKNRFRHAADALTTLIDEDAAAYQRLSAAFKLPKSDAGRAAEIGAAAEPAALVPLEAALLSNSILDSFDQLKRIGNPNLAADVGAGRAIAQAAVAAARDNVAANLAFLAADVRQRVEGQLARISEA